jgi:hypothetical protein
MNCPYCDSPKLRNSQLRASDFSQMLLMRLPVRCRNCQERCYVRMSEARQIRRASMIRREENRIRKASESSTQRDS